MTTPTRDQIDRTLRLQQSAYEALVWLDLAALARPQLLDDATVVALRDADACVRWVRADPGRFPERLRPPPADLDAFARLFASFFQNSFRIERRTFDGQPPYHRIVARKDEAAGKDKLGSRAVPRALEKKRRDESAHLVMRAIVDLAGSDQAPGFWDTVDRLLADPTRRGQATLWAYACGLVRRADGRSDGPALHRLWLDMPRHTRERLSTEQVCVARDAVSKALGSMLGATVATATATATAVGSTGVGGADHGCGPRSSIDRPRRGRGL